MFPRRGNRRTHHTCTHTCTHPALIALIAEPMGPLKFVGSYSFDKLDNFSLLHTELLSSLHALLNPKGLFEGHRQLRKDGWMRVYFSFIPHTAIKEQSIIEKTFFLIFLCEVCIFVIADRNNVKGHVHVTSSIHNSMPLFLWRTRSDT